MKKLFKKSLAVILVVVIALAAAPLSGFVGIEMPSILDFRAEAAEDLSGTCGDGLTWILNTETGVLTISGTGPMMNYDSTNQPWDWCSYYIKSVVIANSVTTIGDYAFSDCHNLTTVAMSNSVTIIGDGAFTSLSKLTTVNMSNNVTIIGDGAFSHCGELTNVTLPDSLNVIGDAAFLFCSSITSVNIPNGITVIGAKTFAYCDNLKCVSIPDSVTTIGDSAFVNCFSLTDVYLGEGSQLVTIGIDSFSGCTSLRCFLIPNSVTTIGDYAFYECSNLEYLHIPHSVEKIGFNALETGYVFGSVSAYICSTTTFCTARSYALAHGIKFKLCDGKHETDKPTDDNEDKPYKVYGRDFKHNLDYFAKNGDSSKYDPELANMLAALSAAVYNENDIKQAYEALGFDDCVLYDYESGFAPHTVGYALAFKQTESGETICMVTVRGSMEPEYNADHIGNFDISHGLDGKHNGFSKPANRIYENIQNYLETNNVTGDVKYFVTGHSRGAAVGNLLSVKLMENDIASSDVYNYNYATPDVAAKIIFPEYNNIFNVCNRSDVVPHVPGQAANTLENNGTSWGKYGKTYWFTNNVPDTGDLLNDVRADHDVNLYLEFTDSKVHPNDLDKTAEDRYHDITNQVTGLITKFLCPVDVIITDENGKKIASVINGEINYYDSAFGDVIILTDGDKKFIYINGDNDFNVNLVGTDNGEMTYSVEKYNIFTEETLESKTFENVKLEKGKEMQSPVCGDKTVDDVSLYVYENNNGKKTVKYAVNTDGSEIEISEAFKNFAIKQPSVTTIKYGDTLVLNADIGGYTLPAGYTVKWFVEGAGVSTSVSEDGLECRVTSVASGNATIYAKLVDADENVVTNVEGEEILDEITITSKAGFWQKFISFFKNLFRINRIIY